MNHSVTHSLDIGGERLKANRPQSRAFGLLLSSRHDSDWQVRVHEDSYLQNRCIYSNVSHCSLDFSKCQICSLMRGRKPIAHLLHTCIQARGGDEVWPHWDSHSPRLLNTSSLKCHWGGCRCSLGSSDDTSLCLTPVYSLHASKDWGFCGGRWERASSSTASDTRPGNKGHE